MIYPQYETIRSGHFKVVTVQGDLEPLNIQNCPEQGQCFGLSLKETRMQHISYKTTGEDIVRP